MTKLTLLLGDISDAKTNVIVNAANNWLLDGSGVTGAIFGRMASSKQFTYDCEMAGYIPTGSAFYMPVPKDAKDVPWQAIIHAVAPIWERSRQPQCRALLFDLYRTVFKICAARNVESIAFPLLGTGSYSVPLIAGVDAFLNAFYSFYEGLDDTSSLKEVQLVVYDETTFYVVKGILRDFEEVGSRVLPTLLPPSMARLPKKSFYVQRSVEPANDFDTYFQD